MQDRTFIFLYSDYGTLMKARYHAVDEQEAIDDFRLDYPDVEILKVTEMFKVGE